MKKKTLRVTYTCGKIYTWENIFDYNIEDNKMYVSQESYTGMPSLEVYQLDSIEKIEEIVKVYEK